MILKRLRVVVVVVVVVVMPKVSPSRTVPVLV
jgi:hypothetical protein